MSKQRGNTNRSKNTEDEPSVVVDQPLMTTEDLETAMQNFNKEDTKLEICRQIKTFEALIKEEVSESNVAPEGQEPVLVTLTVQSLTLPLSGKTITAKGQALKLACELVEAWNKSTRVTIMTTGESKQLASNDIEPARPSTDSAPKFTAVM